MCTYLKNMAGFTHNQLKSKSFIEVQQAFNKTMDWINIFVAMDFGAVKDRAVECSKRAREELESNKCTEIVLEDEDVVTVDATPLSSKSPTIIDYKTHKEGKKNYFQIIRVDGNSQLYLTFGQMFKSFKREDLEVLWSIVKNRFKKAKPVDDMDNILLCTLKIVFEHEIEDTICTYQQGLAKLKN
ncbi:hypothetical protein Tco_0539325 [Tanacetum coccineum]